MFIKRITIQGFKTYRNTTIIEDVSLHLNVVVGRNGLGKSNFFSAIRFVLSDAYTHMTREERQGLIHEGSDTVLSAYVEVMFDNTDRRLPIQKDEVVVRRTIGLKKDDYALDGRSVTRSDVMNLLESAGFSRSNPYYIVPQGKITALTNSKDSERLQLLKEVSGAKMFEAKLRESGKEMTNSKYKMDRIDESMLKLSEKLADLQVELNDLSHFQHLDRQRKVYEFNLFDRELNSVTSQIELKDVEYEELVSSSKKDLADLEKREALCQSLQESTEEKQAELHLTVLEREQSLSEFNKLSEALAHKEVLERELSTAVTSAKESAKGTTLRVSNFRSLIRKNKGKISELLPFISETKEKEHTLKEKLAHLTSGQRALYAKQALFLEFTTKAQRDVWLKEKISTLRDDLTTRTSQMEEGILSLKNDQQQSVKYQTQIEELEKFLKDPAYELKLNQLEENVRIAKINHSKVLELRKIQWREEIKLKSLCDLIENELSNINHIVVQTMDRFLAKALEAVDQIVERLSLQGSVYGKLVDLFSVSDKYRTAVEVVAGNSLFHVVVDTDETALILMKELTRMKAGRITLIPLNRIEAVTVLFPEQDGHEFIPLIKKLKYPDYVAGAIRQVFGRTIVCNSLQRGYELSRQHGLNAITLDGDRADTKGLISGGYRQFKHSRLDVLKLQAGKRTKFNEYTKELHECSDSIEQLSYQCVQAYENLDKANQSLEEHRSSHEPHKLAYTRLTDQKSTLDRSIKLRQKSRNTAENVISSLRAKIEQYEKQLTENFTQSLSDEELCQLEKMNLELADLEVQYNEVVAEVTDFETKIAALEDENSNYKEQLKQIDEEDEQTVVSEQNFQLEQVREEVNSLAQQAKESEKSLRKHQSKEIEIAKMLRKSSSELAKANKQQAACVKKLESVGKTAENMLSQKAIMSSRREELQGKIRALGVLPEEAFQRETFDALSMDQLLARLTEVNTELKQYAHINKKAIDQYSRFAREKEGLEARKSELEESKESIESLVESLKQQKDAAIEKSFKEVSRSFSEIFETLVPNGCGQLKIITKDHDSDLRGGIDNYTGVSILVSFNSKKDEQQHIEQLSGGQKSLCAIALILAIQKCDPAPFYLFDEIDANLDTQYRTAVAALLRTLAANAQFICTTFRPEMLQVANTFYGVSFDNKVSTVLEINQEEALSFVEGQR